MVRWCLPHRVHYTYMFAMHEAQSHILTFWGEIRAVWHGAGHVSIQHPWLGWGGRGTWLTTDLAGPHCSCNTKKEAEGVEGTEKTRCSTSGCRIPCQNSLYWSGNHNAILVFFFITSVNFRLCHCVVDSGNMTPWADRGWAGSGTAHAMSSADWVTAQKFDNQGSGSRVLLVRPHPVADWRQNTSKFAFCLQTAKTDTLLWARLEFLTFHSTLRLCWTICMLLQTP